MKIKWKQWLFFIGLLIADQLTKYWAVTSLKVKGPVGLIPDVLELLYIENRGAAFGILQNKQWLFLVITIIVLAAIAVPAQKVPQEKKYIPFSLCLFFIGAGAVGNMIDRVVRNYVVDFVYFKLIDFPVFNVADIYVTVAAFLLVILVIFYYKDEDFDAIFSKRKI